MPKSLEKENPFFFFSTDTIHKKLILLTSVSPVMIINLTIKLKVEKKKTERHFGMQSSNSLFYNLCSGYKSCFHVGGGGR